MIKYNRVQIDGNSLTVDLEVEDKDYYEGVTITGIKVYHSKTWFDEDKDPVEYECDGVKSLHHEFFIPNIKKELLIIEPTVTGIETIPPDSPCGTDVPDKTAVYNRDILLNMGLSYLRELGDTCEMPKGFIDFMLKIHALDLAITTCNYNEAVKYWNSIAVIKGITNNCGCYGK